MMTILLEYIDLWHIHIFKIYSYTCINNNDDCFIRIYPSLIAKHFGTLLALCLMLLATYYA